MTHHATGMVHGRFQPFHLGHLAYVRLAAARCQQLVVGITNADPSHVRVEPADPRRSTAEANPFPYHLRYRMVREALTEAGIDPVAVVPFPIHEPELWPHYVPGGTVHLIRVLSPWGEQKLQRLQAHGHEVEVLGAPSGTEVSGTQVRRLLADGGAWADLVPPTVARLLTPAG